MNIPVLCQNCGFIFESGVFIENATNVTLKNINCFCPRCHQKSKMIEGTYNFINGAVEILKGTDIDKERLEKIVKKLVDLRFINASSSKDISSFIKTDLPELQNLINFIPQTRTELYAFIALIISLIIIFRTQSESKTVNIQNIFNIYNNNLGWKDENQSYHYLKDKFKLKSDSTNISPAVIYFNSKKDSLKN